MTSDVPLSPPFVGRDREMGVLRRALEETLAGSGRVVLLTGEQGIGKTRLARELSAHATRAGARSLAGRCHDGEGTPAYWPFTQIVRTYVRTADENALRSQMGSAVSDIAAVFPSVRERLPDLAAVPPRDSTEARFRLFDGLTTFLENAARERPLVMILDDLHCADIASLRLLEFVVRESGEAPLLVVGTCRDTELGAESPAREIMGEITRHAHARWLHLGGLDGEAVRQLMEHVGAREPPVSEVARVREESAGNPFFVIELARVLAEETAAARTRLPDSLQEAIRQRLARRSPSCRDVLAAAAVFGCEVEVPVLAQACGLGVETVDRALGEAIEADLITQPGGALRFKHGLVREAAYRVLDGACRMQLHGRIGEVLEALHAGRPDPPLAQIAHHFLEAAPVSGWERGIRYSERAARRAIDGLAYEEAAAHYRHALAALGAAPPAHEGHRCELLLGLGGAHVRAGDAVEARETFRKAAEIARAIGAPGQLARAALGYGARSDPRTFNPDVSILLEEALATAGRDSPLHAQLLARLARELGPPGAALGSQAVGMARRLGDRGVLTTVLVDARFARWGPDDLPERLGEASEILATAQATRSPEAALVARLFRVIDFLELGRIADVDHELAVLSAEAQELRQPWYLEHATALRAMRARLDGRYDEAERLARAALELGLRVGDPTAVTTYAGHRLDLCREQGDLSEQEAAIRQFAVEYPRLGLVPHLLPWLYSELGRRAEARCELERVAAYDFADIPRDMTWLGTMVLLAEAVANLGDVPRAATLYELLRPYAERIVVAGFGALCAGSAALYLGRLATTLSRWEEAGRHLEAALDTNRRLGALPFVARSQHACATMLRARGRPGDAERARDLWCAAQDTAEALGMTRFAEQVGEALARHAGTTDGRREDNLFQREGDYWTIRFGGRVLRVRDTRGVRYLAQLVGNPGREVFAAELVRGARRAGEQGHVPPSDAGEVLDPSAVAAYRRRLDGLRDALRDARSTNDLPRAAQLEAEIRWLVRELSRGLGLRGRRLARSSVERARLNVRKGIAALLRKLAAEDPALGRHLCATVQTGTFCSYRPDSRVAIAWRIVEGD